MKKYLGIIAAALCLASCGDDVKFEENLSKEVVAGPTVEGATTVATVVNMNIAGIYKFFALQEKGEYVETVANYTDKYGSGYEIAMTSLDTIVLYGNMPTRSSEDVPEFNLKMDTETDSCYYWAIDGVFINDALGNKVPASNPYLMLKPEGDSWYYSIDRVEWVKLGEITSLNLPYALSAKERGDITFGELLISPAYKPTIDVTMTSSTEVTAGEVVSFDYTIEYSEAEAPEVSVSTPAGWTTNIKKADNMSGTITLTAAMTAPTGKFENVTVSFKDANSTIKRNVEMYICRPTAAIVLSRLGDGYSMFKEMIASYNEVDDEGNVTNSYLDMYDGGSLTWSMRIKDGGCTMLIPHDTVIEKAMVEAKECLKNTLGREPNQWDLKKWKEWILRSCFYDSDLGIAKFTGTADLKGISGSTKAGKQVEAALWRPTVQKVSTRTTGLYNGSAYYIDYMRVPYYIVIYRIKSRPASACAVNKTFVEENTKLINGSSIYCRQDNGSKYTFGPWTMSDGHYFPKFNNCIFTIKLTQADIDEKREVGFYMNAFIGGNVDCDVNDDNVTITAATANSEVVPDVSLVKIPAGEYKVSWAWSSKSAAQVYDISYAVGDASSYSVLVENQQANASYDRLSSNGYAEYWTDYFSELSAVDDRYNLYNSDGTYLKNVTFDHEGFQQLKWKYVAVNVGASDETTTRFGAVNAAYCESNVCIHSWCLRPTESVY